MSSRRLWRRRLYSPTTTPRAPLAVRCICGAALYSARHHKVAPGQKGKEIVYQASKEVILCGGAFNTPQLLMLSGIGPRADLQSLGIEVRIDSPGVGKNLQDRYEIGVVARAAKPVQVVWAGRRLRDATRLRIPIQTQFSRCGGKVAADFTRPTARCWGSSDVLPRVRKPMRQISTYLACRWISGDTK